MFTDDDWMNFEIVRDDYLENMASRENGVAQPLPVSEEDRTLSNTEYALLQSEEFYYPYMDNPDQPWFVAEGGLPDNWTQASEELDQTELAALRAKLPGTDYTEPTIVDGVVTFDLTEEQKAVNDLWDAYLNALTYDQLVHYFGNGEGRYCPAFMAFRNRNTRCLSVLYDSFINDGFCLLADCQKTAGTPHPD